MQKILIIDGHGLAHRAFHAIDGGFTAPDGTPTNMIMGFMNMLAKARDDIKPRCCVAVFDAPGPTFRHELLPQYKATRKPNPPELKQQFPILQDLLRLMGCPVLVEAGVEADDVMASLALRVAEAGDQAVLLSSDKDLLQILGDGISMLRPIKRGISAAEMLDAAAFEGEFGFPPASMPDYLALLGDVADNVPGVAGVGEKTAKQLISSYRTLDALFDSLEDLKPALRKKLEPGREDAFKSRELIRLKLDVPVDLASCLSFKADLPGAADLASRLALSKVVKRIREDEAKFAKEASMAPAPAVSSRVVPLKELEGGALAVLLTEPLMGEGGFRVGDPDGGYADCSRGELRALLEDRRPERVLVTDYKALLAWEPGLLDGVKAVWDLRTAHYLLHPDIAAKQFPGLMPEGADPAALFALARELDFEIDRHEGLRGVMETIDLPLLPVLNRMELWGVRLVPQKFRALQGELEARIDGIEAEIAERAGVAVNLNSPQQVAGLLFERLGFAPQSRTKGKTAYSTSAAVLERLARLPGGEVPGLILEHRELSKIHNGYAVPLQKAAEEGDGVIHTTFLAAFTGTGRLSSRDPNLQNIPTFGHWADHIKEGLIPVREGNVFVAADYSQIELRVLAHLSQEPRLLDAFQKGRDIHRETASWVFAVEPEFVTPELRRVAKMINFGLLYGMSAFGLAERLDMPQAEASMIVKRYFEALPGLERFLKDSVSRARAEGCTRTVAGRIRPVDEVSANGKAGLDRVLINTPIQGTAADIARRAMIDFDRAFASDDDVHLFLQVHDSLVCECPEGRAGEVGQALREIMMGAASLSLPLEAELKTGRSLAEV